MYTDKEKKIISVKSTVWTLHSQGRIQCPYCGHEDITPEKNGWWCETCDQPFEEKHWGWEGKTLFAHRYYTVDEFITWLDDLPRADEPYARVVLFAPPLEIMTALCSYLSTHGPYTNPVLGVEIQGNIEWL